MINAFAAQQQGKPPSLSSINEGIAYLRKALQLDPEDEHSMLPLAALYRQHAPLSPADEAGDLANATRLKARAKEIMDQQNEAETNPPFGFYTSPDARLIRNVKSMRVSAAEQARKLVTNVDAVYPEEARRASVKGKVQFQVDINLAGKVSTAK